MVEKLSQLIFVQFNAERTDLVFHNYVTIISPKTLFLEKVFHDQINWEMLG